MAIRLALEEYCQDCEGFEPVKKESLKAYSVDEEADIILTLVECEYKKRCAGMYRHICSYLKEEAHDIP